MLKETFISLLKNYSQDTLLIEQRWNDIVLNYSESNRYYHNLSHLENLLFELQYVKPFIMDWNILLFSLYYHDVIYDVKSTSNEEDSAEYAAKVMRQLKISEPVISKCKQQITATKLHQKERDTDLNFFIDADLSILGASREIYLAYTQQIRKEYSVYSDDIYIPGRKNVLNHFLNMKSIFKTGYFFEKYELIARLNLQCEIETL